ncbi:MAG: DUF2147 domain-containing protein [Pseudomonadota bacterium]
MRRTALAAACCAALTPAAALASSAADGVWRTKSTKDGSYLEVTVAPCASNAEKTCGTISRAHSGIGEDGSQYEHLGRLIIMDMSADGTDRWDDGKIWAPDDDKTYNANMELNGDVLRVEGCVFVICRGQDWTRVE